MARTSRRNLAETAVEASAKGICSLTGQRMYSAGIYARLSVDSNTVKNESIENQIEIAKAYLEQQPDIMLFGCYSDV